MSLDDIINRSEVPEVWADWGKIPWHEPAFSERMLREHLSQEHHLASRKADRIDEHVDWIHHEVLHGRPSRILDLGCGPGLYASRLAALGHRCVGIDFSPASIAYAREAAEKDDLDCNYVLGDIRTARYGTGFDLVMLVFGEFNTFQPRDAREILQKANLSLSDDGLILLEPQTIEAVRQEGSAGRSWYSAVSGLFSDRPHICLTEHFWLADARVSNTRHFIVDSGGGVTQCSSTSQAYTESELSALLHDAGFHETTIWPSLKGVPDVELEELIAIVARKAAR